MSIEKFPQSPFARACGHSEKCTSIITMCRNNLPCKRVSYAGYECQSECPPDSCARRYLSFCRLGGFCRSRRGNILGTSQLGEGFARGDAATEPIATRYATCRDEQRLHNLGRDLLQRQNQLLLDTLRAEMNSGFHLLQDTLRAEMNSGFRRLEDLLMRHQHDADGFPVVRLRQVDDD